MPIRIHTEGWQTSCDFKKQPHLLEQGLASRLSGWAEFRFGGRLGLVLPALAPLTDLPRAPHLLWQWPKVSKEVKFGF